MSSKRVGKVLITGATGFLGGALAYHLKGLGFDVVGQGRDPSLISALRADGISTLGFAFRDKLSDEQMDELNGVDIIIHAAGLSAPFGKRSSFIEANVAGTKTVLALAETLGARKFIFISSPSIYFSLRDQLDVEEGAKLPRPFNHYAFSKVAAERLVLGAKIPTRLILRPRGIYGPGETTLLPRLIRAAQQRPLPIFRDGVAKIDLTYIDDVVDAVTSAINADTSSLKGIYNISSGEVLRIHDIVELCCKKANINVTWRATPLRPALAVASIAERLSLISGSGKEPAFTRYGLALFAFEQSLNISRIKDDLGWAPKVSFSEGLERTFQAMRK